jgi:TatD DNase family protein
MTNAVMSPQIVDTHCHLDFPQFDDDRQAVLERCHAAGVGQLINPGTDATSSQRAVRLAEQYDQVFAAVGVHPHDAASMDLDMLGRLKAMAQHPRVVAWGEIGLDYYRDLSPRDQQWQAFEKQLAAASELGLPVIIHQREAAQDVMAVLRTWATDGHPGCVLHAFSGDAAMVEEAVDLGFYIGIGGPVTFKNARVLPYVAPAIPLTRLLVETDAPYLAPHPHRGQRNEPAYTALVVQRLAELLHVGVEDIATQTTTNARRLFGLPAPGA